jgi:hypothetical protein
MISFWNNLFRRRQLERDLNDELQAYVDEMAERKIQTGLVPETAREEVLLELGGIERIKDLVRQQRVGFGNLRREGLTIVVAIVAFVCGASAALGVMHWPATNMKSSNVSTHTIASVKDARSAMPLPVLEGRVVDKATGQPLPLVEIGLQEFPVRRYTFTDDTGHFVFSNPPDHAYQLEAGNQRWSLDTVSPFSAHRFPSDFYEFYTPNPIAVKGKDGQPLKGERIVVHGVNFNGKPYPPAGREIRRFQYSTSIVELQTEKLQPGDVTKHLN